MNQSLLLLFGIGLLFVVAIGTSRLAILIARSNARRRNTP
jgi:hypothetical protein